MSDEIAAYVAVHQAFSSVLARGDDPTEPPAWVSRADDDPPEPPAWVSRADDDPPGSPSWSVGASSQLIIRRSGRPVRSISLAWASRLSRLKFGRPASSSAIHSLANSPDWMSARILAMACFVGSEITFGPLVRSPYSAVSLTEYRIQVMPPACIRSTISLSSCRHSK